MLGVSPVSAVVEVSGGGGDGRGNCSGGDNGGDSLRCL